MDIFKGYFLFNQRLSASSTRLSAMKQMSIGVVIAMFVILMMGKFKAFEINVQVLFYNFILRIHTLKH